MKNIFVDKLEEGMSLFGELFAVKAYKKGTTRQDKPYIDIELSDRTGAVRGKIWPDHMDKCEVTGEGDVVKIDASVEIYNSAPQLRIVSLAKETEYDPSDFQAVSEYEDKEMVAKVEKSIDSVKNKHLKTLLKNVFDKDFMKKFAESSAAYRVHHAYKGGLIEHIVEMLYLSEAVLDRYPKMNGDLLVTGILLHDIGKTVEYKSGLTVQITTRGKLLGHIFIGANYVFGKAPKEMPESLLDEVIHMILSHHGELQFGSPVVPITAEAIALSQLDRLSSNINSSYQAIHGLDKKEEFTSYIKNLGAELYRSPYLDELTNEDIPF